LQTGNPEPCSLDWLEIREAGDGKRLAESMFQRCFKETPPDFPVHVLAFWRPPNAAPVPLCYIHCTDAGDYLLGGGVCVDRAALRRVPVHQRAALREMGGLYALTLRWSLEHFRSRCRAIFAYIGDPLSERITLSAGFERTIHKHLLVCWTRSLTSTERADLIAKAHSHGPF
jgi:hypothetical protein